MNRRITRSAALFTVLLPLAGAQSTRLEPFVGEHFEGFETQHQQVGGPHPPGGAPCLLGGLFGGAATLCKTSSPLIIQLSGSATSAACGSAHRTGDFFAGSFIGACAIQFSAPQAAFGGYFVSETIDPMVPSSDQWYVDFLDAAGVALGGDIVVLPGCGAYSWFGWSLPQGTTRVELSPLVSTQSIRMDDLMASSVAPIGVVYCTAEETSLEERAYCAADGSTLATANQLTLTATQLPPATFGFFLVSRDAGLVAQPGGSAGTLCLSGAIGRYVGPGQIQNSGAGGTFSLALDLAALPQPGGPVAAQAGETWRFQAWFRDVDGGQPPMATSNFTAGLEVTLD